MATNNEYNVSEAQASMLHSLLVNAMEGSLRQQLMTGDSIGPKKRKKNKKNDAEQLRLIIMISD